MGWTATLLALAGALATALVARIQGARPWVPGRMRYVPWHAILFTALVLALALLMHVATLAGLTLPR